MRKHAYYTIPLTCDPDTTVHKEHDRQQHRLVLLLLHLLEVTANFMPPLPLPLLPLLLLLLLLIGSAWYIDVHFVPWQAAIGYPRVQHNTIRGCCCCCCCCWAASSR
jgi:hypothetical protein